MNASGRRVLILGGGIGGMATAISLRRLGAEVRIVEIGPEWKVYGAGITITGPTLRAFRELGLLEEIAEQGFFASGSHIHLFNGMLLAESEAPPLEKGLPASGGIMRPKLHEIMSRAVLKAGVQVTVGLSALNFGEDDDEVRVQFSDGSEGRFDLVVAADGIYSAARKLLFPDAVEPTYCGQMSWRVVAPRPPEMHVAHFFFGHAYICGIIPCSSSEVYAFLLQPEDKPSRLPDYQKPGVLKELLRDFGGAMADIREGINAQSAIVRRPFEYAFQPRPWNKGRVVLLGDAAHATTPHLASGAGIAVEDALVLADELERNDWNVLAGLRAFTDRRFERCRFVVEASRDIARRQLERAPPQEIGMLMGQAMQKLAEPV